jgi:UDP-GlcNAc3NAcA epimerase
VKVVTVLGARPQFIKAATVSRAMRAFRGPVLDQRIVHTGQHFDDDMSRIFFEQMEIPQPHHHLGIADLPHGAMVERMIEAIESVLLNERPDWVLVYGDTNSTLAGSLAAAKLRVPLAHVEAGMRSFNARMPEETNRILSDRASQLLLCSTTAAVENLRREGLTEGVRLVGDVMYDSLLHYQEVARRQCSVASFGVFPREYALLTLHRAENTDDAARLRAILAAANSIARSFPMLLPLHPRTRAAIERLGDFSPSAGLKFCGPVSYFEMLVLEANARTILTDSGGVQKEAFFHRVPCITLRDETEWVETVELGWNVLCGADPERILGAWNAIDQEHLRRDAAPYGDGHAADHVVRCLAERG